MFLQWPELQVLLTYVVTYREEAARRRVLVPPLPQFSGSYTKSGNIGERSSEGRCGEITGGTGIFSNSVHLRPPTRTTPEEGCVGTQVVSPHHQYALMLKAL